MHIITLTERQFDNYSKIHSKRNYKQTIEYANCLIKYNYVKLYLGLIDEDDNVVGATLILEYLIKGKYKCGFAPFGYLVNYDDISLFNLFSFELKKYLVRLNYIFLRLDSNYVLSVLDKNNNVIVKNNDIFNNGLYVRAFNFKRKYEAILEVNDINASYNALSRNLKRKIQSSKIMGVSGFKKNDIDLFYSLIKKKNIYNIDYYRNLLNSFGDNFEIFFAKMDINKYLNNVYELFSKEKEKNEVLQRKISMGNNTNVKKFVHLKMKSDKIMNKYKNEIARASVNFNRIKNSDVLASCAIIKNGDVIYFVEEGYNDSFRDFYFLSTLKWEVIRYYYNKGYRKFNLGNIPLDSDEKGLCFSIKSFNPKIYLYSGDYDLVVNKYLYNIVKKINFMGSV